MVTLLQRDETYLRQRFQQSTANDAACLTISENIQKHFLIVFFSV
jgi:hypothetical protein